MGQGVFWGYLEGILGGNGEGVRRLGDILSGRDSSGSSEKWTSVSPCRRDHHVVPRTHQLAARVGRHAYAPLILTTLFRDSHDQARVRHAGRRQCCLGLLLAGSAACQDQKKEFVAIGTKRRSWWQVNTIVPVVAYVATTSRYSSGKLGYIALSVSGVKHERTVQ
jgi:hypothetical protein